MFEMQTDSKCSNSYKKTHYQMSKNTQKRSQETQFHTIARHALECVNPEENGYDEEQDDVEKLEADQNPLVFVFHCK